MIGSCPVCTSKMDHLNTIGYMCKACGYVSSGSLKRDSSEACDSNEPSEQG